MVDSSNAPGPGPPPRRPSTVVRYVGLILVLVIVGFALSARGDRPRSATPGADGSSVPVTSSVPPRGDEPAPESLAAALRADASQHDPWTPEQAAAEAGASDRCSIEAPSGAYHVDASTGDDANPGTPDSPWATLARATAAAPDGATLVVHAGTYREPLTAAGGTLDRPLVVIGEPGTVLSGAVEVSGWSFAGSGRWSVPFTSPFPPPGPGEMLPEQIAPERPAAGWREQVFVDGEPLTQVLSDSELDGSGRFLVEPGAGQLVIDVDPAGRTVEASVLDQAAFLGPGAAGTILACLHVTRFSPPHLDARAAVLVDAAGVLLTDVAVTNSAATGIGVYAPDVTLHRVTARWNGARGLAAHEADGLVVQYSRLDDNNIEGFDHTDCGGGRSCVLAGAKITTSDRVVIHASTFRRNRAAGLWCDLACRNVSITANLVADNAGHGIFFEVSRDAAIVGNVVAGQREPATAGVSIVGAEHVDVLDNVLRDNRIHLFVADDPRDPGSLADLGVDTDPNDVAVHGNVFGPGGLDVVLDVALPPGTDPMASVLTAADNRYVESSDGTGSRPGPVLRFGLDALAIPGR